MVIVVLTKPKKTVLLTLMSQGLRACALKFIENSRLKISYNYAPISTDEIYSWPVEDVCRAALEISCIHSRAGAIQAVQKSEMAR